MSSSCWFKNAITTFRRWMRPRPSAPRGRAEPRLRRAPSEAPPEGAEEEARRLEDLHEVSRSQCHLSGLCGGGHVRHVLANDPQRPALVGILEAEVPLQPEEGALSG